VFFFGAGASKGATHTEPESPPLMNGLYDCLAKAFPSEWGVSSGRAVNARRYIDDFEKAFTEIDLKHAPDVPPGTPWNGLHALEMQRLLAIFVSNFQIDHTR
jgi:hypothetical protein